MTDKKNEIAKSHVDEQWINTPFSFTKIDKQCTLSQQHILFCVSSHLQEYVTRYFNEKREKGNLRSDYMFEVDKEHVAMNVPKIKLKLSELGIESSHYKDLRKTLKELLDFSVRIKIDGKAVIQHVFSNITEDIVTNGYTKQGVSYDRSKGEVELKIDPVVAKYAFDMSQGFIHHIALIARYDYPTEIVAYSFDFFNKVLEDGTVNYTPNQRTVYSDFTKVGEVDAIDTVKANAEGFTTYSLFDLQGRCVEKGVMNNNIGSGKHGVFILQMSNGSETKSVRIAR